MSQSSEDRAAQFAQARQMEGEGRQDIARRLFAEMAQRGDVEALTALGMNMLVRAPLDQYEGVKTVIDAANKGGAEAIGFCGTMSALGAGLPLNWTMAFDCLQASAERSWPAAQNELRLLAGRAGDAWKSLRDAVDVEALLKPAAMREVHRTPRVSVAENFLTPELCDWLVARAKPKIARAKTFGVEGKAALDDARNNSAAEFNFAEMDIVLALIRARIAALTGLPPAGMENPQVLHYAVGQRFAPHYDFLDMRQPGVPETIAQGGQRQATFLVYLNDNFDAAETFFLKLDWRYRGGKGDAILFWNTDPAGTPDMASLHAGLAPTRGEKWLLSQWIRRAPSAGPARTS
jgi:hypothetical protein